MNKILIQLMLLLHSVQVSVERQRGGAAGSWAAGKRAPTGKDADDDTALQRSNIYIALSNTEAEN